MKAPMEQISCISVTVKGKTINGDLYPKDIDIAETREMLYWWSPDGNV